MQFRSAFLGHFLRVSLTLDYRVGANIIHRPHFKTAGLARRVRRLDEFRSQLVEVEAADTEVYLPILTKETLSDKCHRQLPPFGGTSLASKLRLRRQATMCWHGASYAFPPIRGRDEDAGWRPQSCSTLWVASV